MKNENIQLCPNCRTGLESYLLDMQSPVCPYMYAHNGKSCGNYKAMPQTEDKTNNT